MPDGFVVNADLAQTISEKETGLSTRESLAENAGMLFVFSKASHPAFWMKNMKFPIDIIWIEDSKIIDITENAPIVSEELGDYQIPQYTCGEEVDYVLEVEAGFSQKHNLKIGDVVEIDIEK